jgi:hypothetical protein
MMNVTSGMKTTALLSSLIILNWPSFFTTPENHITLQKPLPTAVSAPGR